MGILDNKLFDTASKKIHDIVGEKPKRQEEIVKLPSGENIPKKDVKYGEIYINESGQTVRKLMKQPTVIESKQEMQNWLHQLSPYASPAISIALENQMQVLDNVFSASLAGMAIDNMLFALQRSLQYLTEENERTAMRDNFCMMIQNFVFINEAKLLYASEQNRLEAMSLLGQAGAKMMQCAVNIGMAVVTKPEVKVQGIKKIADSNTPPVVRNPFEGKEAEKMLSDLLKSLAKKKILEEKQMEFDKMMTNLFPLFDRYYEMIGPSILVCGLLDRYSDKMVEEFEIKRYAGVLSRIKDFQPPKKFLSKAPATDFEYARALEIELNAEAQAAENAVNMSKVELEEYKTELKNLGLFKKERREDLNQKIKKQENEIKRQYDVAKIAVNAFFKFEKILEPIKADVNEYRNKLKQVVEKYDTQAH